MGLNKSYARCVRNNCQKDSREAVVHIRTYKYIKDECKKTKKVKVLSYYNSNAFYVTQGVH